MTFCLCDSLVKENWTPGNWGSSPRQGGRGTTRHGVLDRPGSASAPSAFEEGWASSPPGHCSCRAPSNGGPVTPSPSSRVPGLVSWLWGPGMEECWGGWGWERGVESEPQPLGSGRRRRGRWSVPAGFRRPLDQGGHPQLWGHCTRKGCRRTARRKGHLGE